MTDDVTIVVPVVRSTRQRPTSPLCASVAMAVAYARGDRYGDRYRDLLELCLREHPGSIASVIAMTRRLFADVPVSEYGQDELELDDAVRLAGLAVQRGGRVLPVLLHDERFHPDVAVRHLHTLVLATFDPLDPTTHTFWDAEPLEIGGWRMGSRVSSVPPGFRCVVFGWLPPARATVTQRADTLRG